MNEEGFVVGFTGTRTGMTKAQREAVQRELAADGKDAPVIEFHHGDCVGADAQAHEIAVESKISVFLHPPTGDKLRAFCESDFAYVPKPYLDRNKDIVNDTDYMLACPRGEETVRSGTWATIRYAVSKGKLVLIIYPDGRTEIK